jgi:hypothetical protein
MVVVECIECGYSKEITDSRLEYEQGDKTWCPRCVGETIFERSEVSAE